MFRSLIRGRSTKAARRGVRLLLECFEDRCLLHSAVTMFSAGISANAALTGIVQGPDNNFWFTEFNTDRLGRITPAGVVTEFPLPAAGRGPLNITVGPDSNLWFTENTGDRIGRLNPRAGTDAAIQASLTEFAVPGAGSAPNDLVSGPDGALWFTQTGSDQIGRITTAGVVTEFAVPGAGSNPAGITAHTDGALWFTQSGAGQIGRITTAGVVTEFTITTTGNSISDPVDIVSGPAGLFFTDFGRDQIGRITTDGTITRFDLALGRGPHNIAAVSDGNLYFTMASSGRIGRLPMSALAPGRPTSGAPPLEEFDFIPAASVPIGLAVGRNLEDIFIALNGTNAIALFEAHLLQLTATTTGGTVQVLDINMNQVRSFEPFPGFPGPLNVAVNDVTGNGVPDIIVAPAPGGPPHIKIFEGSNNREVASFFAFAPNFRGGVSLAADDVNGDGRADIVVGAGPGASAHIRVINPFLLAFQPDGQIAASALLANFFAFGVGFRGGVSLGIGDYNRDGRNDLIVGAGPGAGPHVRVIDAARLNERQADGEIMDAALLANFFAFGRAFSGGVFVTDVVNFAGGRHLFVSAGLGGGTHVKLIDGARLNERQADLSISDSALLASFFAFTPTFQGGVRVAADDLNSDGQDELMVAVGPGAGPHVKFIDTTRLAFTANGSIADSALVRSYFTTTPAFTGGVFIGADADHRDGPVFGPPGITVRNSRNDINDVYIFQSPANPANTVLTMTVSPFSTATTPNTFVENVAFEFRIANRNILTFTDDLTFRMNFGPPDANGVQDVVLKALPAARFPAAGGVLVKGLTRENVPVRGVGGSGAMFRAAEQDDPFLFDAGGFNALINTATAVTGVVAGAFPRGTSPNGFGPGSTPNFDATNFFGPNANTLTMTIELPSARLTAPGSNALGFWGRAEMNGMQIDRMGRPAINTALIPPLPRGAAFPVGQGGQNRQDRRNAFNATHPRDDRATFTADMVSVLTAFYPAGRPGGVPNVAQATVVANLLLPEILVIDVSSTAGFGGQLVTANGTTFLAGGRKLSDDVISTELFVLTDDDLPAGFGGGPNLPALVTQNVRDDNGQNLRDGSIDPPFPRGNGAAGTGTRRAAVFPYIGARNATPTPVPGTPPPP